jgi:1-acyl-sn-glycerol-3-phosphate acyltransferase
MPLASATGARHRVETGANATPHRWAAGKFGRAFRRLGRRWIIDRHVQRLCPDIDVRGAEHLSTLDGPAIIIANHTSHADTLIVLSVLPPKLYDSTAVAAAADRFYVDAIKGAWLSLRYNSFPIARGGGLAALQYCDRLLDRGQSILMFPEGTRSRTGELLRFHPGPAVVARRYGAPVLPMFISGASRILPPGTRRAQPAAVAVRIGPRFLIETDDIPAATSQMESAMRDLAGARELVAV